MFDFFDEDFPLSKKQEEEYKKRLAEEAEAEEAEEPAENAADAAAPQEQTAPEAAEEEVVETAVAADDGGNSSAAELYAASVESIMSADEIEQISEPETEYIPDDGIVAEAVAEAEQVEETVTEVVEDAVDEIVEETLSETSEEPAEETAEDPIAETVEEAAAETVEETEEAIEEVAAEAVEEIVVTAEAEQSDAETVLTFGADNNEPSPEMPNISEKIASIDEIEAHLHEELRSLGEKLDNMERVVDEMDDGEISEGFDYEYDERYFAEEETPAYRHPELYKKSASKAVKPAAPKRSGPEISLNSEMLVKAGAAIAAAAVALKLLGGNGKKK